MKFIQDKRRLKLMRHRKPADNMNLRDVITAVGKETEFTRKDVHLVITTFIKKMEKCILDNQSVKLPGIGTIFPTVKRSRPGVALNGGKNHQKIIVPAMWTVKFQTAKAMLIELRKIEVSKADVDNLYYKDDE